MISLFDVASQNLPGLLCTWWFVELCLETMLQEMHELKANWSALQAQLADKQKAASQEPRLTKQALADVTAAQQKTAQVRGHRLTFAALHAVR